MKTAKKKKKKGIDPKRVQQLDFYASEFVDLCSNTGSYVRRYPQDQNAVLVTVAQNESFRTVDPLLLYIHFTDLAYHDPRRHHEGHHHR